MTPEQVADWMRSQGVSEATIRDEASYIATKYADPDEDPMQVLQQSLPTYLQRTASGTEYRTTQGDPAVSVGGYTAPYRPPEQSAPSPVFVPPSSQHALQIVTPSAPPIQMTTLSPSPAIPMFTPSFTNPEPSYSSVLFPTLNPPTQSDLNPPPAPPPQTPLDRLKTLSTFEMLSIGIAAIGLLMAFQKR